MQATHEIDHEHASGASSGAAGDALTDPVCGMTVAEDSPHRVEHGGRTVRFCCGGCKAKFEGDPEKYLGGANAPEGEAHGHAAHGHAAHGHAAHGHASAASSASKGGPDYTCPMHPEEHTLAPGSCAQCGMALEPAMPTAPATRTEYTCPMHPEVVADGPGSCPKCGMALEPRTVTVDEGDNPELADMRRRFWFSVGLTVPLLVIAMGDMLPGHPASALLGERTRMWVELALATPVVPLGRLAVLRARPCAR